MRAPPPHDKPRWPASARRSDAEADASDACWGSAEDWDTTSPAFLELKPDDNHWTQVSNTFGSGVEWLFRLMPGMRGKLYGRSLTLPCRCEACAYTLDTLIMYLDEDTMGWYTPDDIQHIMMDRFCYGIKWLYRSACHHILTAYFDDIAAMAMGHMTGLDICRVLRFCPYYYRYAPAIPLPPHRLPAPRPSRAPLTPLPSPAPSQRRQPLVVGVEWLPLRRRRRGRCFEERAAARRPARRRAAAAFAAAAATADAAVGRAVLQQQTPPLAQAAAGTPPLGQPPQGQPLPPVRASRLPLQLPGQPQPQPQPQQPPQQPPARRSSPRALAAARRGGARGAAAPAGRRARAACSPSASAQPPRRRRPTPATMGMMGSV